MRVAARSLDDGVVKVLDVPTPSRPPNGAPIGTAFSLISARTERAKDDLGRKSLLANARSRPGEVRKVVDTVRQDGLLSVDPTMKTRLQRENSMDYGAAGIVMQVGALAAGPRPGVKGARGEGYAGRAEISYVASTLSARVPDNLGGKEAAFAILGATASITQWRAP